VTPAAVARATALAGPARAAVFVGHPHAASRVWRWEGAHATIFVKQHVQPRKFAQERLAYGWLGPRFPDVLPVLLAAEGDTLFLSSVPGHAEDAPGAALAAAAGRWIASVHAAPWTDADPMPLVDAVARRLAMTRARGRVVLPDALEGWVEAFAGVSRVWCHRDYTPRNWLSGPDGLRVIDLEHAMPDAAAWDVARASCQLSPAAFASFCDGYGPLPEPRQVRLMAWLFAAGTVQWGEDHGDRTFAEEGHRWLAALRSDDSALPGRSDPWAARLG
jgi:hypothetical protein